MKLLQPSYEILSDINADNMLRSIESAGRLCYQSGHKVENGSAPKFVKMILERGHLSVIEHVGFSVMFISNRGFSHEQVRHRIASFSQESTRFCNYSTEKFGNEISCIDLTGSLVEYGIHQKEKRKFTTEEITNILITFAESWEQDQDKYNQLIDMGVQAQFARNVLPIGLKTSIAVTCNLREWREIFTQRAADVAHPQMKELMRPLLAEIKTKIPIIFDDLNF